MWFKEYRDYPIDTPLIQKRVESGHGIIGCEMHELNGWGLSFAPPLMQPLSSPPPRSFLRRLVNWICRG